MNMHWIDWIIVGGLLLGLVAVAMLTKKLMASVADFLVANRCAGRYLLTMASGMSNLGAISIAANFEKFYEAGFAGAWWAKMMAPLALLMAISGFVIYRYRETRVMTMAQLFEIRYSRRFRIFAGMLAWTSGILNYGIFPAVTARFLVYFTGLPPELTLGGWTVPTIAPVMFVMLSLALLLVLTGGQITVMITDFLQAQFVNIVMLITLGVLFWRIGWHDLIVGLQMAPEGQSRINPFKQANIPDFNAGYFLMMAFLSVYGFRAWQGNQGYDGSARSPHEAKMAAILGEFRGMITQLLILLLPIFAFALMHLPQFGAEQAQVHAAMATLDTPQLQKQMLVPAALSTILPIGLMGLFAAVLIAAAVSTDDTYLHSWGSIFIQDVVMPFRKNPLSPQLHMLLLRSSILFVAVFAFVFSLLFPLNDYILMYFQITGAIYLGGAGSAILGGLYWKRGTVEGAWAGMITGSVLAVAGNLLRNVVWPGLLPAWKAALPDWDFLQSLPVKFPLNGVQMAVCSAGSAVLMYVVFSLVSRRPPVDMDRLLNRGKFARETEGHHPGTVPAAAVHPWLRRLGLNADFTLGDKFIYFFKISWVMFFFVIFFVGTLAGSLFEIPDAWWIVWWGFFVAITATVAALSVVWFLWGGFRDFGHLMRDLRGARADTHDDGWIPRKKPEADP